MHIATSRDLLSLHAPVRPLAQPPGIPLNLAGDEHRRSSKGPDHPAQSIRIHRSRTLIASSFNQPEHAAARLPVESSSLESSSHPPEVSDPPIDSPIASAAINPSTTSGHLPIESGHQRFRSPPEVFDPPIKTSLIAAVLHLAPMPLPGHYKQATQCGAPPSRLYHGPPAGSDTTCYKTSPEIDIGS
uniref:Uncharacterized protein n=1 Tax=Oryza sativa subsp. japonica TaxID=39947 RepID=Q69LI1_ORYSJ|nr:unknown protein [Oryza sativa Japonica Group]